VALGSSANADKEYSVALGSLANASGAYALASGQYATASGQNSIAIGRNSSASMASAVAVGRNSSATVMNGVALGSGSKGDEGASTVSGYDVSTGAASTETSPVWRGTAGALAVGDVNSGLTRRITDVAAGANDTDAVNVAQLKKVVVGATGDVADELRIEGMNFSANSGAVVHRNLGQTLAIRGQGTTAGSYSGANVRTVSDPASGAVNLQMADAPVFTGQVSAPTYVATGANPVIVSGSTGTINELTNKTFDPNNYTSGQAATEDQLAQVDGKAGAGWNITANGRNPSNVGPGQTVDFRNTDGNIRIGKSENNLTFNLNPNLRLNSVTTGDTRIDTRGLFINGGPSVTRAGIDAAGQKITNVADGTAPYDAVNRGQLNALDNRLSRAIDKVDDRASAGIASAMAAASVPQATIPGANLLGAGTGYYNGHSALSIGYSALSDNGKWIIRSNFSVNSEDAAVSAGIGYQW
ncbi:MAG: hypothetical protein GX087_05550, partial [Desulfobulbaceae bacterium]|nr:hypothetical protein [Desulfobulbaceae bacterium]